MSRPIKSDELFAAWSRRQWKSVYLFAGTEDFLIEQAVQQACAHWLGDDTSRLNLERFDGEDASESVPGILQACRTLPFLGNARVIRVDNAAKFSVQHQEALCEMISTLPGETHLLLIWGREWRRDDTRKPLVEMILEKGQVVIFWTLFPEQAQRWVLQRIKHYKKNMSAESAAWLVQQLGENMRPLDQELAKCCDYVGDRPEIELEDVQASFGYHKATSPFEWLAGVRQKRIDYSSRILNHLLEEGEEPLRLLALLSRTLRDWLGAKHAGEAAGVMAMRFHLKRGEENRFVQDLARWTEEELLDGIGRCLDAEQSIKSGKETPQMALTLLSLGLGSREPANALR